VVKSLSEVPDVKVIGVVYKEGFEKPYLDKYPSLNEIIDSPEVGPPNNRNRELNSPFEVIYTSGTTGDPKGVVIKANRWPLFKFLAETYGSTEATTNSTPACR